MDVQAQSSKAAEEGAVTDWSAKSHQARDMLQVVVRVGPHKVKGRAILHRDGDGRIAIADPKRTGAMSESTIIKACALSRTTGKRDNRVSSFNVGTVIWPDGDLVETIGAKATEDALNGFNVSIFAYGETGSDKTSSLFGVPNTSSSAGGDLGLLHKICSDLLHRGDSVVSSIGVSFIEIRNGRVRSLLQGGACGSRARQEGDLDSLDTVKVESLDHFRQLMVDGLLKRQKNTKGHALLSLKVEAGDGHITRVNMVDLAGSERECIDRESLQVRSDLSNLGAVLRGISSSRKTAAIPFRESTLTSLLKDSLSVRARTTVLVTVSPSPSSYIESTNSLKYAQKLHVTASGSRTDAKPLDRKGIIALMTDLQGADKSSRREVFRQVVSDPRQVIAKAMMATEEKMDRSPEDRQPLDNVVFGGSVRGAVLEEAFSRVPDPVAEGVAEVEDEMSRSRLEEEKEDSPGEAMLEDSLEDGGDGVDLLGGVDRETMDVQEEEGIEDNDFQMLHPEEKEDSPGEAMLEDSLEDGGDGVDLLGGVGRETMDVQEEEGIEDNDFQMLHPEEKEEEEEVKDENSMAGEGFGGDRMALSRRKTGRVEQTTLGQSVRKGRGEWEAAMARNAAELEENAFANHFAEELQHQMKQREEDEARARAVETRLLERVEQLEGLLANEAQHRVVASALGDGVEQHREVVEVPRRAHAPRYTRILWVCGVVLGSFGLLSVAFLLYLNVTYGPKVI